jgi:hypothetical protein
VQAIYSESLGPHHHFLSQVLQRFPGWSHKSSLQSANAKSHA